MNRYLFLFIAALFLLFPFVSSGIVFSPVAQYTVCFGLIFTIGMAHGAIDNVLYLDKSRISVFSFYLKYLLIVFLFVALWFKIPTTTLIFFLLISAYHFGQSQLANYFSIQGFIHRILYFSWGLSLLTSLLKFRYSEILQTVMKTPDLSFFMPLLNVELITTTYYISTITTVCLLIINVKNQKITINALSLELFVILLLNISFAVFPLLVSFTIYFIFLHSLKVLDDEFNFLKTRKKYSLKGFIKQLLPNTIASIIGTVILVAGTYLKIIDLSYGFIMMIIISSVTFPHAFVMNIFYDNLGSNQPS